MTVGPACANGRVFVSLGQSAVFALDLRTGEEKWSFRAPASVCSIPTVAEGAVVIGHGDGFMHGLDAATGRELWKFKMNAGPSSGGGAADGMVYVPSSDQGPGTLYALDLKTGEKKSELKIPEMIATPIFVAAGALYFGTFKGGKGYSGTLFAVH